MSDDDGDGRSGIVPINQKDDDGMGRPKVTLRLDRELLDKIDDLARDEGVHRIELVRRLLVDGLVHRRIEAAVRDYAAGRRTAWSGDRRPTGLPRAWKGRCRCSRVSREAGDLARR